MEYIQLSRWNSRHKYIHRRFDCHRSCCKYKHYCDSYNCPCRIYRWICNDFRYIKGKHFYLSSSSRKCDNCNLWNRSYFNCYCSASWNSHFQGKWNSYLYGRNNFCIAMDGNLFLDSRNSGYKSKYYR